MQALHQSGIIVVDKPPNISSAKVVARVKRLLGAKKVGHTGTLDPFAEGVLICCINEATRLAQFLLAGTKRYEATLKLGIETDTQDSTGTITATKAVIDCTEQRVRSTVKKFIGPIDQQPPIFSALKHKGTPLYKLARQGRPVQKPARRIHISKIKILEIKLPLVHLEVSCSAGTYIRTLCADIGKQLGCGGHLLALKRTQSSGFTIQQALSLSQLEAQSLDGEVNGSLISMTEALADMPQCRADQKLIKKIRYGQPIRKTDIDFGGSSKNLMKQDTHLKIVDANNALLAVIKYNKNQDKFSYACVFQN
ncbi:MAG: tRNA pseudouridine(55) synthase TruB [Deltaproteobacteria bacterium]|nr:tRNA pseudouridine(55) synthase TruB [Deltaproteobacteria bacterium]